MSVEERTCCKIQGCVSFLIWAYIGGIVEKNSKLLHILLNFDKKKSHHTRNTTGEVEYII